MQRAGSPQVGGQKPAIETQPGILDALNELVEPSIRGDPEAALRWVSLSQRHLSAALAKRGFIAGQKLVGRLLKRLDFGLQANCKTREAANHPDRNAQFEHVNATVKAFQAAGQPVISVDTKKKELVGDFKNGGRELRPKGQPQPVRVHDFAIAELGKAVPYGIYDVSANAGFVNVGISADTGEFSVASIRRWWYEIGAPRYPNAKQLLINADCGGSNGARLRLWKRELQVLADQLGIEITVCHVPPGISKWNKIEHRLFSFITQNWRGKPLISYLVIVQLIASTTTDTGQMELYFRPEVARRMMRLSGLRPLGAFSDPLELEVHDGLFANRRGLRSLPREIDPGGPCASRLFVGPA